MSFSSDSWQSPSPADDSDADPLYEPKRKRNRKKLTGRRGTVKKPARKPPTAARTAVQVIDASEDESCSDQPCTSQQATLENRLHKKLMTLQGKRRL